MKVVNLLHNPTAGNEDHKKEELVALLEKNGFECRYSSMKEDWKQMHEDVDFIVAAGGDGTLRKVTKELLKRKLADKTWPIALLPLGTANNVAQTLGITGSTEEIIESWQSAEIKKFDVGKIEGLPDGHDFFLESFGYGLFPYLIKSMKKLEKENPATPEDALRIALGTLHESIYSYKPKYCKMTIDEVEESGNFLLVEIMNTQLIGPNLFLAPHGDPGDGAFDIIQIPEMDKDRLAAYINDKLNGKHDPYHFRQQKGKNISIAWEGNHVHIDDQVIKMEKNREVKIEIRTGLLEFLVPGH